MQIRPQASNTRKKIYSWFMLYVMKTLNYVVIIYTELLQLNLQHLFLFYVFKNLNVYVECNCLIKA